jgi:hypothetical protein
MLRQAVRGRRGAPTRSGALSTSCRSTVAARQAIESSKRGSVLSPSATRISERSDDRHARRDRRRALHELPPLPIEHRAESALAHHQALPPLPGPQPDARRAVQIPPARPSPLRRRLASVTRRTIGAGNEAVRLRTGHDPRIAGSSSRHRGSRCSQGRPFKSDKSRARRTGIADGRCQVGDRR